MKEYIIKIDEDKKDIMGNCPLVEKPQEVVRCKDCKHYDKDENSWLGTCLENGVCSVPDWFCADGERG